MPCNNMQGVDWGSHATSEVAAANRKISELEAILCAVVGALGIETLIHKAKWKNAGVDEAHLRSWWAQHQAKDAARIASEKER